MRPECDATTEEDRLLKMIKQLRSENAELKATGGQTADALERGNTELKKVT